LEFLDELVALLAKPAARAALAVLATVTIVAIAARLLKRVLRSQIGDSELRYRAGKVINVLGYAVVAAVITTQVAGRFSGLTIALGAASAGIAFALQEVIASFAGWLAVVFGGFYKVGDRIQLGGIKGDVIDVAILRTTIMECGNWIAGDLYNGRIVRVANSFVFKEPVFNYSGEFPFLWDEIVVPIKYGSDYERARGILQEAAAEVVGDYAEQAKARWSQLVRAYRIEDARIDAMVTLVANDNWVELTLRYVVDHRARRTTKDALFTRILSAIEATSGKVAMASMTVQLVETPEIRVSLRRESERTS
jgi:small-conductance mechanosensitive channel